MTTSRSFGWFRIVLQVFVPAGLTLLLFVGAIYGILLPRFEDSFLDQKREMIRELTGSVYALVDQYYQRQCSGELTLAEAQHRARERIRAMRYGPEGKDYFWINDLQPVMVMHPYRTDLEGQNVRDYPDANGKPLFLEFIRAVKTPAQAGYVDYMWQWKDDASDIVPKLSYVRLFEPWGWIIGTGVYIEDVHAEMGDVTAKMEASVIIIFLVIVGISGYLIWQGVCSEFKRQRAQRQREILMKSLEIKNEELESVVYIASHDLRSPLVNLQGFSDELERSCQALTAVLAEPDGPEKDRRLSELVEGLMPECLGYIKTNTVKMKLLVEGLLQLSRLGVAELTLERLDMHTLVQRVIDSCGYQIKSLEAAVIVEETLPACRGDSKLVDQVFTNLIDNALKYRHPDRRPDIHISGRQCGRMVEYHVSDNGVGMEQAQLAKIFEMFHQIKPDGRCDGVGLGLTIVKRIVGILDGDVRVTSEPGAGTTFILLLPAAR